MASQEGLVDRLSPGHVQSIDGEGVVNTRLSLGEMAMTSVDATAVSATQVGAGANVVNYPPGPLSGAEGDPSGKQGGVWVWNMGAGTAGQQRGLRFQFYGRGLGLRYRNYEPGSITLPTLAVVIDGKVYPIPRQATYFRAQPQSVPTAFGGPTATLIDGDLEDRAHTCDIIVTGNKTNNFRFFLYGLYLDRRYYHDAQRLLTTLAPVKVGVGEGSAVEVPLEPAGLNTPASAAGADRRFRFVDHLLFTETAGETGDVVILRNGEQIDRITVPGKSGVSWPRKATKYPLAIDGAYKAFVPSGGPANIYMTTVGGK